MGRGSGPADEFARRDREAAVNFGEAARDAGVERVIYLGGLGDDTISEHLRSRHEVAELLRQRVPGFVYVRAAMVVGPGSASFEMLSHLVRRLPRDDRAALARARARSRSPSPTSCARSPTSPSATTRRARSSSAAPMC